MGPSTRKRRGPQDDNSGRNDRRRPYLLRLLFSHFTTRRTRVPDFVPLNNPHAPRYFSNRFRLPLLLPNGYRWIVNLPSNARTGITYQIPFPTIVTTRKSTCDGVYGICRMLVLHDDRTANPR